MGLNEIFGILLLVAVLGLIVYVIRAKVPMDGNFKRLFDLIVWAVCLVIGVVVVFVVLMFLLNLVGIHPRLPGRVG